ncbi:Leucine-, isoleucine-, valine-, threonine-, and alanine-binding protein [bioreactor metagenome]|uniref:Leucine-, isoleucine-, valine-, threonine-, and alanine-binding protein n=1 Tax=bioreactor metagenome TaxID=1076179 RepID=A0A644ZRD4_9ZZZZ
MNFKMKKLTALFTVLAMTLMISLTAVGCSGGSSATPAPSAAPTAAGPSTGTIKVGASFPLSGSVATDGKMIVTAIQMAVDEFNAAGGVTIGGTTYTVALDPQDDEADPTTAATIANKFADDKNIMAVISSYNSSCMLAQVGIYDSVGLSSISPVATSPDLTGSSAYFHRVVNSDKFTGALDADVMKALGYTKVAALYEDDDYGFGLYESFKNRAAEIGLEVIYTGTFVYGETKDFSTLLTNVASSGADAVFWGGLITELGLYLSQSATFGADSIPVYADTGCYSPAMITEAGAMSEGLVTVGCFDLSGADSASAKFISGFVKAYGSEPSLYAALAYDAAWTLFDALGSVSELSRESINQALETVSYDGITGTNKFDETGDVSKAYSVYEVKGGKWVPLDIDY